MNQISYYIETNNDMETKGNRNKTRNTNKTECNNILEGKKKNYM